VSATNRILLGFLAFLAAGLWFLQSQIIERVERQYLEAAEEPMVDAAQFFAALLEQTVTDGGALDLTAIRRASESAQQREFSAQIYSLHKTSLSTHLYVTDRRGVVLYDSDGGKAEGQDYSWRRDVRFTLAGEYGARSTGSDPSDSLSSVMFVGAPIRHRGAIIGVVSVSKPQRSMFVFIDETKRWIRGLGLIAFGAMAVGAVLVTSIFSRPIRRLTDYARAVAQGERIAPPRLGPPEVATLGRAFEEMRDALEDRRYVESYVQSLTHEMKSPVAAIRGAAELLHEEMPAERRAKFLGNIQAEARRLQNIIDRLLALSAIESRKALVQPEPVALVDLAEAVRAQLQPAADARGIRMELTSNGRPTVRGESFLLEIALTNLLQNAIDFSPPGGCIGIRIACADDAPEITVCVEDEGAGIPDYALPRVFERFYSLQHPATGRKSSGLGLCFVREAAALHGGTITLANRADCSGARAELTLPLGAQS
jgi:two-component system sensor histidine kinase CreC